MRLVERAKRILAAVILICFFLPLAQCSFKSPAGDGSSPGKTSVEVLVPAQQVNLRSADELGLVAMYIWPLAFILLRAKARSRTRMAVVSLAEAAIGGLVLWCVVQTIRLWGTVRYGGVILVCAHAAYLLAVAVTLYRCARPPAARPL